MALAGISVGVVTTVDDRYSSPEELPGFADVERVPVFETLLGRFVQIATVEGATLSRWGIFSVLLAVWDMLAGARLLRRAEECGHIELVGRILAGYASWGDVMAARIEFRMTPELRCPVERAVDVLDSTLTDFAEASLAFAAQHIMADRGTVALGEAAAAEWEAINARPARELHGLRRLMGWPSPFDQ